MSDEEFRADQESPTDRDEQIDDDPVGTVMPFLRHNVGARAMALAGLAVGAVDLMSTITHTTSSMLTF